MYYIIIIIHYSITLMIRVVFYHQRLFVQTINYIEVHRTEVGISYITT